MNPSVEDMIVNMVNNKSNNGSSKCEDNTKMNNTTKGKKPPNKSTYAEVVKSNVTKRSTNDKLNKLIF